MLHNLFPLRHFRLTKWSFLEQSTKPNAPYIQPSHDSILELWRTFPNASPRGVSIIYHVIGIYYVSVLKTIRLSDDGSYRVSQ